MVLKTSICRPEIGPKFFDRFLSPIPAQNPKHLKELQNRHIENSANSLRPSRADFGARIFL